MRADNHLPWHFVIVLFVFIYIVALIAKNNIFSSITPGLGLFCVMAMGAQTGRSKAREVDLRNGMAALRRTEMPSISGYATVVKIINQQ